MLGQRPDPNRGGGGEAQPEAAGPAAAPAKEAGEGGIKAWLPLLVAIVAMPVVAYGITTFVLVPRLQKALRPGGEAPSTAAAAKEPAKGEEGEGKSGAAQGGDRQSTTIDKLLVNVAGTMGSRYLLTSITLIGDGAGFKDKVELKKPQLRDMASGLLNTKTIADLEKPGARNLIRGELLAGFNTILGAPGVQEIYFTEFAIQ
jgi:flagellar FliL protein